MGNVYKEVIQEFYPNAIVEGDCINCWLKSREFYITMESIQEILEVRPTTSHTSLQYDERMENLGPIVEVLGGQINKKALHTIPFTPEMRTLVYIMIFNLYQVRNLTNLLALRAIFLFDLFTHKEINIYSHIYHLFTKCITKRNARIILPFPSLNMSLITKAGVKISSGLQVMQRDYPINAQINKKALHTILITSEKRTLVYIMILNLYPVRNLTNLSASRAILDRKSVV